MQELDKTPQHRPAETHGYAGNEKKKIDLVKWIMFPFLFFNAAFVIALYIDDVVVIDIWYMRVYFYLFFMAQIWLLAQFYLYISMRPPKLDIGDRFRDPVPDKKVTVLVSCYNEPVEVIEKTLRETRAKFSGKIILIDDSTQGQQKNRIIAMKYRVAHFTRRSRRGFKAGGINDILWYVRTPYVALLDSDAVPKREFFDIGLAYLKRYEIVQFPQYYSNRRKNAVTRGAYAQQIPFMYRIMPLRNSRNSAFMLGTNLLFHKDSILDLGGFDEASVTEDLATSVRFHERGYRSVYITRNTVDNSAPESLRAYFIQQKRWAQGTMHVFKKFATDPERDFSIHRYADYFIGSSWYFYGFIFPFLASSVFFFSVFHISFVFTSDSIYYTLYIPFVLLTFVIYLITLMQTGHGVKEMYYNMSFNSICFPIYAVGVLKGLFGSRFEFVRTPKGINMKGGKLNVIIPQIMLSIIILASIVVSLYDAYIGMQRIPSLINTAWATFYFLLLVPLYIDPF